MRPHTEHVAVEPGTPQELECYQGIFSPPDGDEDAVAGRSKVEFCWRVFCRNWEAYETAEVEVVPIEELAEAVLVDFIPEGSLCFRECSGTDDDFSGAACFVIADTTDNVESKESSFQEAMRKVPCMDSSVRQRDFFDEFHFGIRC